MTIAETVYEKLKSAPPETARAVLDFLEFLEAKSAATPLPRERSFDEFRGVLDGAKSFAGDPVEIQRKLRQE